MDRLITFGCSLTYGHGLPDCFIPPKNPGPEPSKMGWASTIAKYMNRECVNQSSPGASNKKIWNTIINFDFKETDIVFILWSHEERYSIIKKDTIVDIGIWTGHDSFYKDYYDENDAMLMSKLFVNHANMFVESKNIRVFNMVISPKRKDILTLGDMTMPHIPVYVGKFCKWYPYALDRSHPGIECNEVFSKKILDYLNLKNDLPNHTAHSPINRFLRYFTRGKK